MLKAVSAPLISRPQTKIDVWLANLSADVLISGTYVKPLFVMQHSEMEHAKCWSAALYRNKEQRWGWVIIPGCPEHSPIRGPWRTCLKKSAFPKWLDTFCILCCYSSWREWPALPPDLPGLMTVVHHVLSAAAPVWLATLGCPALISIWPAESWT